MGVLEAVCLSISITMGATPSEEELLAAWARGCQALPSYDVYLVGEHRVLLAPERNGQWKPLKEPVVSKSVSRQVRSSGKRRIEWQVVGNPTNTVAVWDGEALRTLRSEPSVSQLTIEAISTSPLPAIDYEAFYRSLRPEVEDLIEVMRVRPGTKVEGRQGEEYILYTPAGVGPFNMSSLGFRVWLDSTKNFMPTRIQHFSLSNSDKETLVAQIDNTLEEVQPGVWAPVKSVMCHFAPGSPPRKGQEVTVAVDLQRSKFSLQVPDSMFKLEAPAGARVYNGLEENGNRGTLVASADQVPDFEFTTVDGRTYRMSELKGKTVLIYFLGAMIPQRLSSLEELYRRFQSQGLVVLAIGPGWKNSDLVRSKEKLKLTLPLGGDPERAIYKKFARSGFERLYLVGPDGKIVTQLVASVPRLARLADAVEAELPKSKRAESEAAPSARRGN